MAEKNQKQYFRELDELGRIVPPMAFRKKLHINPGDELEFWMDNDTIVMKKVRQVCIFCGSTEKLMRYKKSIVCQNCVNELKNTNEQE